MPERSLPPEFGTPTYPEGTDPAVAAANTVTARHEYARKLQTGEEPPHYDESLGTTGEQEAVTHQANAERPLTEDRDVSIVGADGHARREKVGGSPAEGQQLVMDALHQQALDDPSNPDNVARAEEQAKAPEANAANAEKVHGSTLARSFSNLLGHFRRSR